jgi:signal transduction histidine kinase
MSPSPEHSNVALSIEHAIAYLAEALDELDRLPSRDPSTVGFFAHVMNNYLTLTDGTVGLLEKALRDHSNREVATWLAGLRHLGTLMHHALGRLLHASPTEDFPLKPEEVNLPLLMERVCEYYRPSAGRKQLEIACRSIGEVPTVWVDRVAVAVVADNLMSNAVKFSNPAGQIVVQILPGPGGVVCSVQDNGRGLTPLEQVRLFQPASRPGPPPTAGEPSSGFGLAIAKELVDRMGGRLWSESESGRGACFSFRVPYRVEVIDGGAGGSAPGVTAP